MKFRLLDAEILLRQGHPKEVVALLAGGDGSVSASRRAIRRSSGMCSAAWRTRGSAGRRNPTRELRDARRLAESSHSTLIGDVLRAEALVLRDSGHSDQAHGEVQKQSRGRARHPAIRCWRSSISSISASGACKADITIRPSCLSQEAATFAKSIQARRQLQLALGNIGWADYNLGDFDNALANFRAAEQQAKEIGMTEQAGLCGSRMPDLAEYKLGHLEQARKYDEEALQVRVDAARRRRRSTKS